VKSLKTLTALSLAALLSLSLTSCGYQGFFRYPCQDPKNWEIAECKPPICSATQTCPVDLVKTSDGTTATVNPEGTTNE
jgi:predicted small lipoprotein YifL